MGDGVEVVRGDGVVEVGREMGWWISTQFLSLG